MNRATNKMLENICSVLTLTLCVLLFFGMLMILAIVTLFSQEWNVYRVTSNSHLSKVELFNERERMNRNYKLRKLQKLLFN
jgi:hypothetical protein